MKLPSCRVCGTASILLIVTARSSYAQKPLRNDDRAYSSSIDDRGYVAARCAALYSKMVEAIQPVETQAERDFADAKMSAVAIFLKRVPHPQENVFLEWAAEYGIRVKTEAPTSSVWGQDYEVCQPTLLIIRDGDHMNKYSRSELGYMFAP